jgi:CRISPR-associated protein Csd1
MSEATTSDYRTALNHLLRHQAKRLAGAKVAYWFKDRVEPEDDVLAFLEDPSAEVLEMQAHEQARKLLEALRQGQRPDLGENRYYALTLSGQSGRVMVRDWMEGGFPELVENVNAWFDDLSMVRREGGSPALPPKFMAVMGSCVRDLKDLPGPFAAAMWKAAIRRLPIPLSALAQALARFKVRLINDESPTLAGVGLMKAYFVRKGGSPVSPYLNPEHPQPAYHCGRLLAMLAALQRSALGDVGAGVVQRYYAAASATPALVLGRLARTAQFHLNKLEPGLAYWYESQMAQVWGSLGDGLPPTLSLEGQSLFALGYYQQLADLRTKKNTDQAPVAEEN